MDIQMPVLDGHAAVRMMRKDRIRAPSAGDSDSGADRGNLGDDIRKAFEAGCSAHVAKPIRKEALLAAIAAALENSGAQPLKDPPAPPHY